MSSPRPRRLVGILGTHTEVGKTQVTASWLAHLRQQGLRVGARKPVQSYAAHDTTTDARRLAAATGEDERVVCPAHRSYPLAVAPPMAADLLQRPRILLPELLDEIVWPANLDVGAVETVGGPRSPLAHDGDSIDFIHRLQPDVALLIADAGLGALNAIRLSLAALESLKTIVFLNRFDAANELHQLNRRWLVERDGTATAIAVGELKLCER